MEVRTLAPHDLAWLTTTAPPGWFDATGLCRMADPALSVSFWEDSCYVGSAGLFKLWEGVYEAWLVLDHAPRGTWAFLHQLTLAYRWGARMTQAHRIQAYCLAEYTPGLAVAKRLGFSREAVLRCATPMKTDIIVLAKVRR